MQQAFVIGVAGFGKEGLHVGAVQWAYDSEDECLTLIFLGHKDRMIPIYTVSLSNVIPKEFVLKVTKDKRKIKKPRNTHIIEKHYQERLTLLRELAQYVSDSDRKTWTKEELIKFFQAMKL